MKKLLAALCGLLSVTAAQACNWNAENCTFEMLNNIQRKRPANPPCFSG